MGCCGSAAETLDTAYDVGDGATITFRFVATPENPTAVATAFTVTLRRPDGSLFRQLSSPDASLSSSTETETIDGVVTTITLWVYELSDPFDVGSRRRPWRVRGEATEGLIAAVESERWVRPQLVAT